MHVTEVQGHLIDLVDDYGNTSKIGLVFKRPFWHATHYETGLDCTPWQHDSGGMPFKEWKNKDALIEELKRFDFHGMCKRNPHTGTYKEMIAAYRRLHHDSQ